MRQIVLDTETTGTEHVQGDRVIEIGCLELLDRRPSGRKFHCYLNPDRDSHPKALEVHGLTTEFLSDKPRFIEVVDEFLDFVRGAELIIHNASFDVGFLDAELERCGARYGALADHVAGVVDTLLLARELYPGQRSSLDVLCKRFGIDNSGRSLHGALLDAGLLLDVYIALTSGQFDLALGGDASAERSGSASSCIETVHREVRVVRASPEEQAVHQARVEVIATLSGRSLWPDALEA
ncbi:DNA polymerase III subunit epsilon [Xanthomonadaceae bacterium JHOS43]|nr:DNA polymerase III subunit epsilon [Xanthomonadaceae bacterium JHOS43]MCX7563919.1 DNA polymerase III subunit epsilon [Xanthomonadaceae bacterium XH05]